jgi:hypothetical protein
VALLLLLGPCLGTACTRANPAFTGRAGSVDAAADAPELDAGFSAPPDLSGPPELPADAALDLASADAPAASSPDVLTTSPDAPGDVSAPDTMIAIDAVPVGSADASVPLDSAADVVAIDLSSGLIGYWRLDDGVGATVLHDSSGHGNHGKFEGPLTGTRWVAGHFGQGFELVQSDRSFGIRVEASDEIAKLQRYTVAAWIFRPSSRPSDYCAIISREVGSSDAEVFNMSISKDYLKAYGPDRNSDTGSVTTASSPTPAPLNVWVHVAATFDGTTIRVYQDGVLKGSDTYTDPLPTTSTPLYLATNKNSSFDEPFLGVLDEVMLYDRALPAAAIAALAQGNRPPIP